MSLFTSATKRITMSGNENITQELCKESEMKDGEMREFVIEERSILLVKSNGTFSAVGNKCSHYGAPLSKGFLAGDRLRCPWHGACFNVKTGDIEEYPGLDSLPCYKVTLENGSVHIAINKKTLENAKRVKAMCRHTASNRSTVAIIGAGPAALVCAETLRQEGYSGKIVMVTRERHLPYDRPKLSKAMNAKAEDLYLRPVEFYSQHDIEVWTEKEAVSVNTDEARVKFRDGSFLQYSQLLIATGSRPRELQYPGSSLKNVFYLRSPEDATAVSKEATGKNVVIMGSSFIGMEVAAFLSDKANSVSVIGKSSVPFQAVLGNQIGTLAMKLLQEHGVNFYMRTEARELHGENGQVKEVRLRNGTVLPADVVLAGIGVVPVTNFLKGSRIAVDSRGAVYVDQFMRTSVPDVFAAGDVVSFPLPMMEGHRANIGHWQMAHSHGRIAALNMLNKHIPVNSVPFFWTSLLGKSIRYAGFGEGYTEIILKGALEEMKFLAFYLKDDIVVAVSSMNFDPTVSQVAEAILSGRRITKNEVMENYSELISR
ncbi:apoptosis-inducing factor 3-like isoform X1 [Rana temporaria]|uniref:apoptosis-inducing factor 3-like isoform X1 n=2 Tax=Rana temporaria TaxID=8407 RepID=UPI001AAC6EE9|nr:apoptosis-inducing factor 3-like isoform X1 [Rana temporaria]